MSMGARTPWRRHRRMRGSQLGQSALSVDGATESRAPENTPGAGPRRHGQSAGAVKGPVELLGEHDDAIAVK